MTEQEYLEAVNNLKEIFRAATKIADQRDELLWALKGLLSACEEITYHDEVAWYSAYRADCEITDLMEAPVSRAKAAIATAKGE